MFRDIETRPQEVTCLATAENVRGGGGLGLVLTEYARLDNDMAVQVVKLLTAGVHHYRVPTPAACLGWRKRETSRDNLRLYFPFFILVRPFFGHVLSLSISAAYPATNKATIRYTKHRGNPPRYRVTFVTTSTAF